MMRREINDNAQTRSNAPSTNDLRRPSKSANAPVGTSVRNSTTKYIARTLFIWSWFSPRERRKIG